MFAHLVTLAHFYYFVALNLLLVSWKCFAKGMDLSYFGKLCSALALILENKDVGFAID